MAKAFGRDKLSWEDRVAWTHSNEDMLRRIASDPLGNRQEWEHESDKLWAALAAAREWTSYLDSGRSPSFITTLPVFIDGTCNGLQHYAALSGDPKLARLVNLEPGDKREFFDENERKRRHEWGHSVDDQEATDLRVWLAKRLEAALKGKTESADAIMKWLQDAMRLLCDRGVADKLDFRTPASFPWKNLYFGHTKQKVKLTEGGRKHAMTLAANDTSKFNGKDADDAVAPNFAHGLDAAAMQLAICEANSRGVTDMMAIHDCIGGLAPDMDIIAEAVRIGFVKCHDAMPLERFREAVLMALPDGVKLDPLPDRGEFDVRRVLESGYFFC